VSKTDLLRQLGQKGYAGKIASVEHLGELRRRIETNHRNGVYDEGLYRDYLSKLDYAPPENAKSLVVVARRQRSVRFVFAWNGRRIPVIVPPAYLHTTREDRKSREALTDALAPEGYAVAPAKLPEKLLAVQSGLATYGRNNITYVAGMGSFHRLSAFYTEMPCENGDDWREPAMLERCESCRACVNHCPSGAISMERFLIRVERCIAFHGEKPGNVPFPDWIDPSWHDCLFGCLDCQNICPENKGFMEQADEGEDFSPAETELLLAGAPVEKMPASLAIKLKSSDLKPLLGELPRNLRALLTRSCLPSPPSAA
jgi:epoxyqueuosine reductase